MHSRGVRAGAVASSILFCLGAMASATPPNEGAQALADPAVSAPYVLRWDAPEGCPSSIDLRRKLDALSLRYPQDPPLQINAEVRSREGRFQLSLKLSGERARLFEADTCPLLAETLVVLSAVALGSAPAPSESPGTADRSQFPPAARVPKGTPILAASTRTPPNQTTTRAASQFAVSGVRLDATVGVTTSLVGAQGLGPPILGMALRYRFRFVLAGLRVSFASSKTPEHPSEINDSVVTLPAVQLTRWTLTAEICGGGRLASALPAWDAWFCMELGPSTWAAAADGLANSTPQRSGLWLSGGAVRIGWHFTRHWAMIGGGQVERPFHRLDWAVRDPRTDGLVTLYRTPALGTSWTLGLAYAF